MGGLSLIGPAHVERVVRPDRDVDLLFPVPVHVPEQEVLRPVGRLLPPFEGRRDILALRVRQRLWLCTARNEHKAESDKGERYSALRSS